MLGLLFSYLLYMFSWGRLYFIIMETGFNFLKAVKCVEWFVFCRSLFCLKFSGENTPDVKKKLLWFFFPNFLIFHIFDIFFFLWWKIGRHFENLGYFCLQRLVKTCENMRFPETFCVWWCVKQRKKKFWSQIFFCDLEMNP